MSWLTVLVVSAILELSIFYAIFKAALPGSFTLYLNKNKLFSQ